MTGWVPDMDALVLRLLALDVPHGLQTSDLLSIFFDNHICWNQAWFTFYIYNQVVLPNSCVYIGWPFLSRNLNCVVASPWHI